MLLGARGTSRVTTNGNYAEAEAEGDTLALGDWLALPELLGDWLALGDSLAEALNEGDELGDWLAETAVMSTVRPSVTVKVKLGLDPAIVQLART